MATFSICPKCPSILFESVKEKPYNSPHEITFVRCVQCGCVVGISESYIIEAKLQRLADKLNIKL